MPEEERACPAFNIHQPISVEIEHNFVDRCRVVMTKKAIDNGLGGSKNSRFKPGTEGIVIGSKGEFLRILRDNRKLYCTVEFYCTVELELI